MNKFNMHLYMQPLKLSIISKPDKIKINYYQSTNKIYLFGFRQMFFFQQDNSTLSLETINLPQNLYFLRAPKLR